MKASHADLQYVYDMSVSSIYLMGGGFILGSLFTILLLVVLDWYRRSDSQT